MDKITHEVRCEQWTRIINECLASGMNKTAWCKANGISDKSFFTGRESCETKLIYLIISFLQQQSPTKKHPSHLLN